MDHFLPPLVENPRQSHVFRFRSGHSYLPPPKQCKSCDQAFRSEHGLCSRCIWRQCAAFDAEEYRTGLSATTWEDDDYAEKTRTIPPLQECDFCTRSFLGPNDICARCRWYEYGDFPSEWKSVTVVSTLDDDISEQEACEEDYTADSESTILAEDDCYQDDEFSEHLLELQAQEHEIADHVYDSDDEWSDLEEDKCGQSDGEEDAWSDDDPVGGARLSLFSQRKFDAKNSK